MLMNRVYVTLVDGAFKTDITPFCVSLFSSESALISVIDRMCNSAVFSAEENAFVVVVALRPYYP